LSDFGGTDSEPQWFGAAEGLKWASKVVQHLRENLKAVKDADAVVEDLEDYVGVFKEADSRGLKWHFELIFEALRSIVVSSSGHYLPLY